MFLEQQMKKKIVYWLNTEIMMLIDKTVRSGSKIWLAESLLQRCDILLISHYHMETVSRFVSLHVFLPDILAVAAFLTVSFNGGRAKLYKYYYYCVTECRTVTKHIYFSTVLKYTSEYLYFTWIAYYFFLETFYFIAYFTTFERQISYFLLHYISVKFLE